MSTTALNLATHYTNRGWRVVPIPTRKKNPGLLNNGWQEFRLAVDDLPKHFNGRPKNVGVLLGEPSTWLVDVDLDHVLARELAPEYLPSTPSVFGRAGSPRCTVGGGCPRAEELARGRIHRIRI